MMIISKKRMMLWCVPPWVGNGETEVWMYT